jgi:acyl-coenzyme A thioesterase PaaI-like protein
VTDSSVSRPESPPVFLRDGDAFIPTVAALGPWRPDALHGSAVAALIAHLLDRDDSTMARLTIDLVKPVPQRPLTAQLIPAESGSRVFRESVVLLDGDRPVARGTCVRMRKTTVELPPIATERLGCPLPPPSGERYEPGKRMPAAEGAVLWKGFANLAAHMEGVYGSFNDPGPIAMWHRLVTEVVEGHPPTALERLAAAADYASAASAALPFTEWTYMNADLTIQLARPLVGEWVGIVCETVPQPTGVGFSQAALYDEQGQVARAQPIIADRAALTAR